VSEDRLKTCYSYASECEFNFARALNKRIDKLKDLPPFHCLNNPNSLTDGIVYKMTIMTTMILI